MARFHDSEIAHRYLDDLKGVEIGGSAHNAFHLPNCINVDYTDSMDTVFKRAEIGFCGEAMPVDVVAYGEDLPFKDGEYDYVISSHVLEHIFDPIAAMKEWLRVIKSKGYVFTIVPRKEATNGENRPITTLQELIDRYEGKIKPENVRMWDNQIGITSGDGLPVEYITKIMGNHEKGHFTVFDLKLLVDICNYSGGCKVVKRMAEDDKVGNGICVICLKN
jgi:SAM-dependent methyltransferase